MAVNKYISMYGRLLERHPWKLQSLQTGVLMAAGDIISQTAVEGKKLRDLDPVRIVRFGGMGLFFVGPGLWAWYRMLHNTVRTGGRSVPFKKLFWDQAVAAPPYLFAFLVVNGTVQQQGYSGIKKKMEEDYWDILKANWKLWPAVQLINFGFIPLKFQVLFEQMFSIIWNTYLAWKTNRTDEVENHSLKTVS